MATVLVADDDPGVRFALTRLLDACGDHEVIEGRQLRSSAGADGFPETGRGCDRGRDADNDRDRVHKGVALGPPSRRDRGFVCGWYAPKPRVRHRPCQHRRSRRSPPQTCQKRTPVKPPSAKSSAKRRFSRT